MKHALLALFSLFLLFGCTLPWESPAPPPTPIGPAPPQEPPPVVQQNGTNDSQNGSFWPEEPPANESEVPVIRPSRNVTPRSVSDNIGDGEFDIDDPAPYELSIHVINSSMSDSVLIVKGDFAMLVDAGDFEATKNYMEKIGVAKLNAVVATRDDPGAIGGLSLAAARFEPEEFWYNGIDTGSQEYGLLLERVGALGMTVKRPVAGDSMEVGGMTVQALNPSSQRLGNNPDVDAVVLKVSYGNFCMLLLNPTVQEVESGIAGNFDLVGCEVMTYYKHGEGRPAPSLAVNLAKPRDIIISVGENSQGLPSQTTLNRFTLDGIRYWRTDLNGTIVVRSGGIAGYSIASYNGTSN